MNPLALGCATLVAVVAAIVWPERALSHGSITTTVLFDREIVRVLNDHCVMCHTSQGIAFPLETYEQTWTRGQAIRMSVLRRHMPPWAAVPGYGDFTNANNLTLRESQFVISWVEGLGPRNAGSVFLNVAGASSRPTEPVRAAPHVDHWRAGEPDLRLPLPLQTVTAGQADFTARATVDLRLPSARRVQSFEYMPGDRRVLRAAVFTLEQTGQWLGSWTPWYGFVTAPPDTAFHLPANARVVAELHYRGTPETIRDRGTLGLTFASGRRTRTISDITLRSVSDTRGSVPSRVQRARTTLSASTAVWALVPGVGEGVASLQVTARTPDGGTTVLLFAQDPSAEWPTPYILARPAIFPAGTELSVSAHYGVAAPAAPLSMKISRF